MNYSVIFAILHYFSFICVNKKQIMNSVYEK